MTDQDAEKLHNKMLASMQNDPDQIIDIDGARATGRAFVGAIMKENGEVQIIAKGRQIVNMFLAYSLKQSVDEESRARHQGHSHEQNQPQPMPFNRAIN